MNTSFFLRPEQMFMLKKYLNFSSQNNPLVTFYLNIFLIHSVKQCLNSINIPMESPLADLVESFCGKIENLQATTVS